MTPRPLQPATVTAKLRLLRDLLDDLDTIGTVTPERLTADRVLLRAVERILTQLVDLAVSVNTHVVTATTGRRPPRIASPSQPWWPSASFRSSWPDSSSHR